jgi:hypothetical protein
MSKEVVVWYILMKIDLDKSSSSEKGASSDSSIQEEGGEMNAEPSGLNNEQ